MGADESSGVGPARSQRPTLRWICGLVALLGCLVLTYLSPARADTALVYIGLLPSLVALTVGARLAFLTALSTGSVMFVGLLLSSSPLAAGTFLALLGLGVAWSYTRGWQGAGTYVATQGALAAVAAPGVGFLPDASPDSLKSAAAVAGFALAGGLWAALVGRVLLFDLPHERHEPPTHDELVGFAIVLASMLGIGTYLAVRFAPGTNVWWVLLTTLVVLVPRHRDTLQRGIARAGGTVLGGAVAAGLVVLVPDRGVLSLIGLVAAVASAVTYLLAPYWTFSASLTVALILLTLPLERALRGDLERVAFTVAAAALVVLVSSVRRRGQVVAADG